MNILLVADNIWWSDRRLISQLGMPEKGWLIKFLGGVGGCPIIYAINDTWTPASGDVTLCFMTNHEVRDYLC